MDAFSSLSSSDYCKGGARVLQMCRGVNDLSIKLRLMETLCTVSPRTQASIKEPSGDVKDATPVFEKLKVFLELHPAILYGTNRPLTHNQKYIDDG